MNDITKIEVYLKPGEEFSHKKTIAWSKKPMFLMLGQPVKHHTRIPGYPILDTMLNFNKEEQRFFKLLIDNLNTETNVCSLTHVEFNDTQVVKLSKTYTALKELDLVKRVGKRIYMINPKAVIPPKTYDEAQTFWDSLK